MNDFLSQVMPRVPAAALVVALLCGLCGCDTSIKQRASITAGMTLEELTRQGVADPQRSLWLAEEQFHGPPRIPTQIVATAGAESSVSCASCHANLAADPRRALSSDLQEFHGGLVYNHGKARNASGADDPSAFRNATSQGALTCLTCHNAENYNLLRLADGSPLEFYNSRTLCGQCHSQQDRDYQHGAHGGMTGYWNRNLGPIERKTCIDCHDPHAPRFPAMHPTFKPHDRFLTSESSRRETHE